MKDSQNQEDTKKEEEKEISEDTYSFKKKFFIKLVFSSICIFVLTFFINFPFKKILITNIEKSIKQFRACPIGYENLEIDYFPPTVALKNVFFSQRCFNKKINFQFSKIESSINFPSFFPFGIKTSLTISSLDEKTSLKTSFIANFNTIYIKIPETIINETFINDIASIPNLFTGTINLKTSLSLAKNSIKNGVIKISSQSFNLNKFTISGIKIPTLSLGSLNLKTQISKKNTLTFQDFKFGNSQADFEGSIKGSIGLNLRNIQQSKLNIKGKIRIGQKIFQAIPLLKLFTKDKKKDKKDFYNFSASGLGLYAKVKFH